MPKLQPDSVLASSYVSGCTFAVCRLISSVCAPDVLAAHVLFAYCTCVYMCVCVLLASISSCESWATCTAISVGWGKAQRRLGEWVGSGNN